MPDSVTLKRIDTLHPLLRNEALAIYSEICVQLTGRAFCRFTHTLRSFKEQAELYAQGRTKLYDAKGNKLGKVTNAKPGFSFHQYGLAGDIVLVVDTNGDGNYDAAKWDIVSDFDKDKKSDWMECIAIFKRYGWLWGGDWKTLKDYPHVEKSFGLTIKQCLDLYNNGKMDADGYINIPDVNIKKYCK